MNNSKYYNIIILNHHADSPDTGGGGRHYQLGKLFSQNGHKTTVIASYYRCLTNVTKFKWNNIVEEYVNIYNTLIK
jgi:hypothetical protein